jgi:hypothetical protein
MVSSNDKLTVEEQRLHTAMEHRAVGTPRDGTG